MINATWGLLVLLILFFSGFPVAYSIGVASLVIMKLSSGMKWLTIIQQMVAGLNSFTILTVPLFLLAGKMMNACGVTDRLFKFAKALVGWLPGGLGYVNVLASFIFAGMSGTAIADATGLGQIEIKAMSDAGYDKDFSCAVTSASSTLGPIIPPSMPLVVYGTISGASIGALFVAGVFPGIIMAMIMCGLCAYYAIKNKYPRTKIGTRRDFFLACRDGILPCLTPVIILLGIYTGIFTPTESAAIVVIYSTFLGVVVYKQITWKELINVLHGTVMDAVGLCILLGSATLFGNVMIKAMIPQTIMKVIVNVIHNKIAFILVLNVALMVVGMFMETVSSITILTPIILPVAVAFGIDPVHLGIIMVLNLMIGVISPPFGVVLFAITRIGEISFGRLVKALIPWFIILIVSLLIVSFIPQTCLWLPSTMYH